MGRVVDDTQVAGSVGVPPGLERLGDVLLHGGGDGAVHAADAGQPVAESFGLRDLSLIFKVCGGAAVRILVLLRRFAVT